MTLANRSEKTAMLRLAALCAGISAVVSAFGIVFLLAFFGGLGGQYGTLNDIAVILQYLLMLPIAYMLWRFVLVENKARSMGSMLIGMVGMLTVIWLQSLLVSEQIDFGTYIVIVSTGFLVAVLWFVLNGQMGRKEYEDWPTSVGLDILAGLFFGYPFWAWKMRNWFKTESG